MEVAQSWRMKFSFRNATIVVCFLNVLAALLLLQGFLSSSFSRSKISASQFNSGFSLSQFDFILLEISFSINWDCLWVSNFFPSFVNFFFFFFWCSGLLDYGRVMGSFRIEQNWIVGILILWFIHSVVHLFGLGFFFFPKEFNPDFNWVFSIKNIFKKKLAVADWKWI